VPGLLPAMLEVFYDDEDTVYFYYCRGLAIYLPAVVVAFGIS